MNNQQIPRLSIENRHSSFINRELKKKYEQVILDYNKLENTILYSRSNFFLISESMLLVAYTSLLSRNVGNTYVSLLIGSLGLLLAIAWLYVNARQKYVINFLEEELISISPAYKLGMERFEKWPISSRNMFAYYIPSIMIAFWIILLMLTV